MFELAVELGEGIVGVAIVFFVVGFGLALFDGVVEIGLGQGLEREEDEAEGGGSGVEAPVVFVDGLFSAVLEALEKKNDGEEREKGEKGLEKEEIEIHSCPFCSQWVARLDLCTASPSGMTEGPHQQQIPCGDENRKATATAGKARASPVAAMFPIAGGSGLRGRRTLEEGGPNVEVWCKDVVLTWLVRDGSIDPLDEEEDRDQKEEGCSVMVRCLWEQEQYQGDDGGQEGERFPSTNC